MIYWPQDHLVQRAVMEYIQATHEGVRNDAPVAPSLFTFREVHMLRIAICDDNNSVCSEIEKIILNYQKYSCVKFDIDVFFTGESLINFIEKERDFDLIFLDIELGTTTGIEVGSKIRVEFDDHISKIVFITSKTDMKTSYLTFSQ